MRKKILTIILIATMCLNMVACSNSNSNTDEGKSSIETIKKNEDQEKKGIEVDKKLLSVEVTIPADFFQDQDDQSCAQKNAQ